MRFLGKQKSWSEKEFGNLKNRKWKINQNPAKLNEISEYLDKVEEQVRKLKRELVVGKSVLADIDYDELLTMVTDFYSVAQFDLLAIDKQRNKQRVKQLVKERYE